MHTRHNIGNVLRKEFIKLNEQTSIKPRLDLPRKAAVLFLLAILFDFLSLVGSLRLNALASFFPSLVLFAGYACVILALWQRQKSRLLTIGFALLTLSCFFSRGFYFLLPAAAYFYVYAFTYTLMAEKPRTPIEKLSKFRFIPTAAFAIMIVINLAAFHLPYSLFSLLRNVSELFALLLTTRWLQPRDEASDPFADPVETGSFRDYLAGGGKKQLIMSLCAALILTVSLQTLSSARIASLHSSSNSSSGSGSSSYSSGSGSSSSGSSYSSGSGSSSGSSDYETSDGYPTPRPGESTSDYIKRADPDLYDSMQDQYDVTTGGSSSDYDTDYDYATPKAGESASDYIKRADPDLYDSMQDRYDAVTGK